MAATLSLDTITSSGSTITVPTGKTLAIADAGALTLGTPPVAITTGAHVTATSSANPTTIVSGDITGKSNYAVVFDASSGTSTEFVVNLPAPADFATTVITVRSNVAHGAGNKITIKDSGGTEVYTLYHLNDYCTFISDGTNTIRTGDEWVTIRGEVALTANYSGPASTTQDFWDAVGGSVALVYDIGDGWSTTNDEYTVPHSGLYRLAGHVAMSGYSGAFGLKSNGTWIQCVDTSGIAYSNSVNSHRTFSLTAGDVIQWWVSENAASPITWYGNAAASGKRCTSDWWCLRRY